MNIVKYFLITVALFYSIFAVAISNSNHLAIQTDKLLYVSGESVQFKCTRTETTKNGQSILYVDLCGEGYLIDNKIFKPINSHWEGNIVIPDSVQTGVYILRAYFGDQDGNTTLNAIPLSIINRFGNNEINENRKKISSNSALNPLLFPKTDNSSKLAINQTTSNYKPNQAIKLNIESQIESLTSGLSLTVFKTNTSNETVKLNIDDALTANNNIKIFNHLTISGRVTNSKTKAPVANEIVLLSIPDSIPNIEYAYTSSDGIFRFQLNDHFGKKNIIVQTINKSNAYDITLFPMFLMPPRYIPYYLPPEVENHSETTLSVLRTTLQKAYETPKNHEKIHISNKYPFYGISTRRIYPGIYIDLEDFNEIAWEILPTIKYRVSRDSTYLRIWDHANKTYFEQPMMLVDGIPVFNPASFNFLNTQLINWIEIQPQTRCYGNLLIDGLIAIQTFKGDFSDISLPANAIKANIETFHHSNKINFSDDAIFRDVLFWEPYVEMQKNLASIEFPASTEKGNYIAVIQAFDSAGVLHQSTTQIIIED